jgi:hypothetical protein
MNKILQESADVKVRLIVPVKHLNVLGEALLMLAQL